MGKTRYVFKISTIYLIDVLKNNIYLSHTVINYIDTTASTQASTPYFFSSALNESSVRGWKNPLRSERVN